MDASAPPRYRRFSSRPGQVLASEDLDSELPPSYSRRDATYGQSSSPRREPTEHVFELLEGKSKPWATLKVYSSAKSSKSLPTFFEKESITGLLELTVEKGDGIQAITATVSGRIISGACTNDSFLFLNQTLAIWSKSVDSSRVPSPSEGASSPKLSGHCVWPLSIPIPRTVDLQNGTGAMRSYQLPETFLERYTNVSIQYDLTVRITRGKLRSDSIIKTPFGYVPFSRPAAPSLFRQLVYQQNLPLPGPSADPEGWKTLRPVSARGVMFRTRPVEVRCTLSVAKPLCYTRGSVLPCFLTLDGRDPAILDVLSSPGSVVVKLRRRVRFYNAASTTKREVSWNESVEDVGSAVWWPSSDSPVTENDLHVRQLEGEIKLAKDLRPSSEMAHFSLQYFVVLCPFKAANYTSDTSALLSEPVDIATMHAKGPKPKSYAPPAYESYKRRSEDLNNGQTYNHTPIL
jgi:hypothetical protein